MSEEYISLKPSDAVHGGGMVPEGDYDVVDAKFASWDYNGTVATAVPALGVEFKNEDQSYVQWYSAGDMRNLAPTEDGKRLRKVGSSGGLNDGSNCYQFLTALIRAGFSEDKLVNDISVIIGMRVAVVHEATQERDIKGQKKKAGVMVVIGKIHSLPGEKKAATTRAAGKGAGKTNGSAESNAALAPKATEALIASLKEADGKELAKKALSTAVFKKVQADPDRSAILNLVIQDAFLSSLSESGVLYDADKGAVMYVGE